EGADGGTQHVTGDVEEEVDVARRGPALLEADEHAVKPSRAFPAGRALAARLVVEEALEDHERPHHADAVVHHHDAGGAEERARLQARLIAPRTVEYPWISTSQHAA